MMLEQEFQAEREDGVPLTAVKLVQSTVEFCGEAYYYAYFYACVPGWSLHAQKGSSD